MRTAKGGEAISMKMKTFFLIIQSLRPKQWTKNLIVFAGLIFSQKLFVLKDFLTALAAFGIFCLLSGAVYLVNDIVDIEKDRQHPEKRKRPLASGKLSIRAATIVAGILPIVSLGLASIINKEFVLVGVAYYFLITSYSFFLKKIVIVDVMTVAMGFVLRAVAGAVAIQVEASSWFLICTILLALFLGLAKRRHELVTLVEKAHHHRESLLHYTPQLLDQLIAAVTSSTILAYALYTMGEETVKKFGTSNLIYTLPFVIYGIFRYLYLMYVKQGGGSPERVLLTDRPLILNILLYLLTTSLILYH